MAAPFQFRSFTRADISLVRREYLNISTYLSNFRDRLTSWLIVFYSVISNSGIYVENYTYESYSRAQVQNLHGPSFFSFFFRVSWTSRDKRCRQLQWFQCGIGHPTLDFRFEQNLAPYSRIHLGIGIAFMWYLSCHSTYLGNKYLASSRLNYPGDSASQFKMHVLCGKYL
jgi:hypothetical protein